MTVNQRITKIYENLQISQYRFAKDTGISTATLNNIVLDSEGKPSFTTIQKILNSYKNLNARWLITGEGEMWLNGEQTINSDSNFTYNEWIKEVKVDLEKECKLTGGMCAFEMLPELKAENEKLKQELAELKKNK